MPISSVPASDVIGGPSTRILEVACRIDSRSADRQAGGLSRQTLETAVADAGPIGAGPKRQVSGWNASDGPEIARAVNAVAEAVDERHATGVAARKNAAI